jgi:iron complex outermembrane receptor protein
LGVLYAPAPNLSLFANRTTSFVPTEGTTSGGETLDPETGEQYEIGVKTRLLDDRITATAALFRLTRGNLAVSDPDNPAFDIQIGEQRSQGLEVSVGADITPAWKVSVGYAYTDAETTKDTDSSLVGKRVRNVPKHGLTVLSDYRVRTGPLAGFSFGGALTYTGSRSGDIEDTFELPSHWLADIYARYNINENFTVDARVNNIADVEYFTNSSSDFEVWRGAPRTFMLSVSAFF